MAASNVSLTVEATAGAVVAVLHNDGPDSVTVPANPVVGVRARAEVGSWRAACRTDPAPAPPVRLAPGAAHRVRVDWPVLLRTDAPPPAGSYLVTLAVVLGDEVRFSDPTPACP